jgi:hypothetical protein
MSLVLELTPSNLPNAHRLRWRATRQGLNVRLLINTDDNLTALVQPRNPFLTPQYLRRSRSEVWTHFIKQPSD